MCFCSCQMPSIKLDFNTDASNSRRLQAKQGTSESSGRQRSRREAPQLCQISFDSLALPHLSLQVDSAFGRNGFNQAHRVTGEERRNVGVGFGCIARFRSHPLWSYRLVRAWRLVKGAPTVRARKIRAFLRGPYLDHSTQTRNAGADCVLRIVRHLTDYNPCLFPVSLNLECLFHNVLHAVIVDNSLHFVKNFSRFVLKGLATHVYNSRSPHRDSINPQAHRNASQEQKR